MGSETPGQPPQVKRVSTVYVPAQDRFRLAAEMEDGQVHAMWLTQRLLRLLIEPLSRHLQQTLPRTPREQVKRTYVELMEKVGRKSAAPIAAAAPSAEWLIDAVNVSFKEPAVHLLFKGEDGHEAVMEIDAIKLRVWMGLLHRKSLKAGWPGQLWPEAVVAMLE